MQLTNYFDKVVDHLTKDKRELIKKGSEIWLDQIEKDYYTEQLKSLNAMLRVCIDHKLYFQDKKNKLNNGDTTNDTVF